MIVGLTIGHQIGGSVSHQSDGYWKKYQQYIDASMTHLNREYDKALSDPELIETLAEIQDLDQQTKEIESEMKNPKPITPERQREINVELDKLWDKT